jgi:hypothetical protein
MSVEVYWNLHKKLYSVRSVETGKVFRHVKHVLLSNAKFVVREGGRQRVLKEQKKNVHAFVRGEMLYAGDNAEGFSPQKGVPQIKYDPYLYDTFMNMDTNKPIHESELCALHSEKGKPTIWGSKFL